jgi:phosphoribosylformylglycinamidine cyclo-ligase
MVHCSGGAQTKVLHFIDELHIIKNNLFPVPPLFRLIQDESKTSWQEMYKVFNMGHRMELYVPQEIAAELIKISESFGVPAQIIGHVEAAERKQVTIKSEFGEFVYY